MATTLLTLFCIWLGWQTNRARQQRIAVEQLQSVSATVSYDRRVEDLYMPAAVVAALGKDFFVNVVEADLRIEETARVRSDRASVKINLAVDAMRRLPSLRRIEFYGCGDDDLKQFSPLASQSEALHFYDFRDRLTGQGVRHLAGWPQLRDLTLWGGNLDKSALIFLADLPALQSLTWQGRLDDEAFTAIASCKRVERLCLCACSFDGTSLIKLQIAKQLKHLTLENCVAEYFGPVSPAGQPINDPRLPAPTFNFSPIGHELPGTSFSSHEQCQEWLKKILPGVEIDWMINL